LTWETETGGDAGHDCGNEVVEVTVGRGIELESSNANVIQSLIVNAESFIRVLDKLLHVNVIRRGIYVNGESSVIGFNDRIRNLGGWDDGEGGHHSIRVFFANFADEKSSHTSTGTTTERVCYLETLKTITSLGFTSNDIQNLID